MENEQTGKIYLKFNSTREILIAEKECIREGFRCSAVPTPREFTSECGIALEVDKSEQDRVFTFLNEKGKVFNVYQ